MSDNEAQPKITENDYAVFSTWRGEYHQLSLWDSLDRAQQFKETCRVPHDTEIIILKRI